MKLFTVVLALAAFAPVQGHKSEIMEVQLKPDTIHPHLPYSTHSTLQKCGLRYLAALAY